MGEAKQTALTKKQEAFARAYVLTANAAEAYRQSHDVADNARDSWLYVEAAQMLEHPKIAPRIKELQDAAKKRSEYTVLKALEELEEARAMATRESMPSAAVSAISAKVKLLGLEQPGRTVHRHTGAITHQHVSEMTDDQLAAIAAGSSTGAS